jgi:hypothetical protein
MSIMTFSVSLNNIVVREDMNEVDARIYAHGLAKQAANLYERERDRERALHQAEDLLRHLNHIKISTRWIMIEEEQSR